MPNANSPVPQGSATLLSPGTDGGLILGDYQGEPDPAFDEATGYSLASRVTQPTKFFNIEFGISTNKIDPQTQRELLAPTATVSGDSISADLSAWAASWNRQEFNQGRPNRKPRSRPRSPVRRAPNRCGSSSPDVGSATIPWTAKVPRPPGPMTRTPKSSPSIGPV